MIEPHNLIPSLQVTPAEMFGPESHLADEALVTTEVVEASSAGLGIVAQLMVVGVAVVYIIFILRYAGFISHFLFSSVGIKLSSQKHTHINPSERSNLELMMLSLGLVALSTAAVRGLVEWSPQTLDLLPVEYATWLAGVIVAGAIACIVGLQMLAQPLIGLVCGTKGLCRGLMQIKLMHLAIFCALVIPPVVAYILADDRFTTAALWSMGAVAFISLILYVKESFLFFVEQKVSILHWILYLCTLEIFPASLLVAPLLRGGVGIG